MKKNETPGDKHTKHRKLFTFSGNSELLLDLLEENGNSRKAAAIINMILSEAMLKGLYSDALRNMLKPADANKIIEALDSQFQKKTKEDEQNSGQNKGVSKAFSKK